MVKEGSLSPIEIDNQLRSFKTKFNALSTKLGAEYADPLKAQNELKAQITTCFDDINDKTALMDALLLIEIFLKILDLN